MAIDKEQFARAVWGANFFYAVTSVGLRHVKNTGVVEEYEKSIAERHANQQQGTLQAGIAKVIGSAIAAKAAMDTHDRHEEIIQRATFVYAWSALEHLLQSCVAELFRASPQHLVRRIEKEKRALDLLRRLVVSGLEREAMIDDLVVAETHAFAGKTLQEKRDYFEVCFDIHWEEKWYEVLQPIAVLRHVAAHEPKYLAP